MFFLKKKIRDLMTMLEGGKLPKDLQKVVETI